ncbi:MAG TPA: hypothetical protein VGE09_03340 [Pseudoxanthomonas sp.]
MGTIARKLLFSSMLFTLAGGIANIANQAKAMFRNPGYAVPRASARRSRGGRQMTAASQRRAAKKLRMARARAPKRRA